MSLPPEWEDMDATAREAYLLAQLEQYRQRPNGGRPRFDWTISLRDVVLAVSILFGALSIWQGTVRRVEILEAAQDAAAKEMAATKQQQAAILSAIGDISVTIRLAAQRNYDYPPHRHAGPAIVYPGRESGREARDAKPGQQQ